tara:strand:- start:6267 stop:8549 length:2283 start_codon:yes stop_codon:yes gene_type:complete
MAEKKKSGDYQVILQGTEEILKIDASNWNYTPSLEDNPYIMASVIDKLAAAPRVSSIIFHQQKNFTYPYDQTNLLVTIAKIYDHLTKSKKVLSLTALGYQDAYTGYFAEKRSLLHYLIYTLLRTDPLGCYVETARLLREEKIALQKEQDLQLLDLRKTYAGILEYIYTLLDQTKLITIAKPDLAGYSLGERSVYRNIFRATITPDFMLTKLMGRPPSDGEQVDIYSIGQTEVTLYNRPDDVKPLYHIYPPEFKLSEDEYMLLDLARSVLAEHKPQEQEFLDPKRMRRTFFNIGKDLLQELAEHKQLDISYEKIKALANILVRYTVGFGLVEVLLQDEKIQDITINSPIGQTPIFIVHQEYGDCITNITPSRDDAQSWATKFRLLSGRPLDEANPVLDTELAIPGARSRVAVITNPLSPTGLAYALRRHRDNPWTLPLFMQNKMISPLASGFLSFLIDGGRTMLFAGTRSSGKTSLLGAALIEIMRKYRIISVEDTLELPLAAMRELQFNVQSMKVRSALLSGGGEVSADEGIRTSLRLGDSSLIVGEIRSTEAKALFEAMRIGALANVVAGTIHGASPFAVFDRVVNDLGVPKTSFKAVDAVIVSNPVKSADGLQSWKRVLQITEVRKHWKDDPQAEGGFVDLFKYDSKIDTLLPTDDLKNGDSVILKSIAGNVKAWAGNWDAIWNNILLRAQIKETLLQCSTEHHLPELLEADFVVRSNDVFHKLSGEIKEEVGSLDNKLIFSGWQDWLKRSVKAKALS